MNNRASIRTEIAFLERIHSFLKPGTGRAAVVLPDGILTNSSLQGVRDWLMARFQLLAVVSLPQFAFQHYDAGVKASIVFLRRLRNGETVSDDDAIFMALAENIGYDATGRKTFNTTIEYEEPGKEKNRNPKLRPVRLPRFLRMEFHSPGEEGLERAPPRGNTRHRHSWSMAGVPARPQTFFRISPAEAQSFAVRRGQVEEQPLSVPLHKPEFSEFINALRNNPLGVSPLGARVEVNPRVDVSALPTGTSVGFIPMDAVSDQATGEYTIATVLLEEVNKGYTRFLNGDVLWAKITPCMQNGKSCVVTGLPNGVGFGSTEFHVLRPRTPEVSEKFVMEFVSQEKLRQFAVYAFTGSAGQQRVPAAFLESLPFPALSISRQHELVEAMDTARAERKAKLVEADALLAGIDDYVLGRTGPDCTASR